MSKFTKDELKNLKILANRVKQRDALVIVGITNDGRHLFYNANKDDFVENKSEATKYQGREDGLEPFFNVQKKFKGKFRRILMPVADSAKDAIGEGKCAPSGIDFVREVDRIEAERNKHSDDPKAKEYLEQRISQMKKLIAKSRIEVTEFDYYWSNHKKELNKNYDEANRLLIALENKL